jgi:hypothetical protein
MRSRALVGGRSRKKRRELRTAPKYGVIDDEKNDSAHDGNQHAVEIQACHAWHPELVEQPPAQECANDAKENVDDDTFTALVDQLARDEAGNESQYDPRKY